MLTKQEIDTILKMDAIEKEVVAYHEAGHAVAFHLLGVKVLSASICRYESLREHTCGWFGEVYRVCSRRQVPSPKPRNIAIGSMAGLCAEQLFEIPGIDAWDIIDSIDTGFQEPSPPDWEGLGEFFKVHVFTWDDWNRLRRASRTGYKLQLLVEDTVKLLTDNWFHVESVAKHLNEHEAVSGSELEQIIKNGSVRTEATV